MHAASLENRCTRTMEPKRWTHTRTAYRRIQWSPMAKNREPQMYHILPQKMDGTKAAKMRSTRITQQVTPNRTTGVILRTCPARHMTRLRCIEEIHKSE